MEAAPTRDPRTRFNFLGMLAAYVACLYGHRSGVLTEMLVKEVEAAQGDDEAGYLIDVSLILKKLTYH